VRAWGLFPHIVLDGFWDRHFRPRLFDSRGYRGLGKLSVIWRDYAQSTFGQGQNHGEVEPQAGQRLETQVAELQKAIEVLVHNPSWRELISTQSVNSSRAFILSPPELSDGRGRRADFWKQPARVAACDHLLVVGRVVLKN
jgi:hypothetical protein